MVEIGRGGFGRAVRAEDLKRGGEVVLKYLHQPDDPESRARFRREIEEQRRAAHDHVMPILDHGAAHDWLVMPVAAETLEEAAPGLSDDEIVTLVRHVAKGLRHAHGLGIVHRDVTPGNILALSRQPYHWVIADFGLVRRPPGRTTTPLTASVRGTLGFIAPELLAIPHAATVAADVYGLGRTLGWITSGQLPEQGRPSVARMRWLPLVTRMTANHVDDRVPHMDAVLDAVDGIEDELRAARVAVWGKSAWHSVLSPLDRSIIWAILDARYEPEGPNGRISCSLWEIDNAVSGYSRGQIKLGLLELQERGLVDEIQVEADDGMIRHWAVTADGLRWARAECASKLEAPSRSSSVEDDIPF